MKSKFPQSSNIQCFFWFKIVDQSKDTFTLTNDIFQQVTMLILLWQGVHKNSNIIDFPDVQLGWNGDNMAFQWCFYYDNWQGNTWALNQIKYQIYFICIYCFRSRKWWASNDAWQHLFQLTDYSFLNLDTEVDLRWPMPQCCSDQQKNPNSDTESLSESQTSDPWFPLYFLSQLTAQWF